MRRGRFRWQRFAWALGLSLAVHVRWIVPKLLSPVEGMLEKKDEVEVAFLPDPDSPADPELQPPEPTDPEKPEPKKDEKKKEAKLEKLPEPGKLPEPEKPKPVPVVQAPPPPPPPPMDKRKQMVSQEQYPDEQDNADATYLAEKNHRTEHETRTEATNLIRATQGEKERSAENQNDAKTAGEREQKIAELENHKGTDLAREAPQLGHEGQSQDKRQTKPGPLSMRNLIPRNSERAEVQQRDGVEVQEHEPGTLPMQRKGQDGERGGATKKGGNVKLTLDHHAYDNIEGFATAERERHEAAKAERSHVRGRYDRYLDKVAALKSALENFTPEVKLGNQAELGTRASPFAAYITAMHRQIHKVFTFGFLADQSGRLSRGPFDDETLWTQVQISLHGDGTVDKVGIVRASGNVAFDAVAVDSVLSAAPFPKPPAAVKSANGKVYMDWQFHRDERACGTFGVDPHILTTPGEDVAHDSSETGAEGKAAQRAIANSVAGAGKLNAPSTTEGESPRRLQREPSAGTAAPSNDPVPTINEEVHETADGWFSAWQRGDVAYLAGYSAAPFIANGQPAAKTPEALRTMYKQMLAEVTTRVTGKVEVLTPGGIRAKTGALPPGGSETGMLFAVGQAGGERFVLLLRKSDHGWRVAGLVR